MNRHPVIVTTFATKRVFSAKSELEFVKILKIIPIAIRKSPKIENPIAR